jgi:hypothetical protein
MLLSQAIDEQRVFNRVTYMPNILECRIGAFWTLAHCRFYPGLLYTHAHLTNQYSLRRSIDTVYVPIQYFTILDRNILDSCELLLFLWFSNHFHMFIKFQTCNKRYGRVMRRIWDCARCFRPNKIGTASLLIYGFIHDYKFNRYTSLIRTRLP